jgi:hypothetical protein
MRSITHCSKGDRRQEAGDRRSSEGFAYFNTVESV